MQASNPLGTLCILAKMTNLSIPWQDYGGPAAYAARADNQEAIYLRLNDRAVGSILAQNEAEVKLHRLAGEAFAGETYRLKMPQNRHPQPAREKRDGSGRKSVFSTVW